MLDTSSNNALLEATYNINKVLYHRYAEMWALIPDQIRSNLGTDPHKQTWSLELARRIRDLMNHHGEEMEDAYDQLSNSSKDAA